MIVTGINQEVGAGQDKEVDKKTDSFSVTQSLIGDDVLITGLN